MFTGIIRALGNLVSLSHRASILSYSVSCPNNFLDNIEIGASISVDGICQTVTAIEGNHVFFDAIEETLNKTTLKFAQKDNKVHLERSAKFGDEIGGHTLFRSYYGPS